MVEKKGQKSMNGALLFKYRVALLFIAVHQYVYMIILLIYWCTSNTAVHMYISNAPLNI